MIVQCSVHILECRSDKNCSDSINNAIVSNSDTLKLLVSLWSDGCNPNARNKTNCGSMHITTISILSNVNRNDENNTFVLAIGQEGDNHSAVRKIIYKGITKLAETEINTLI